MARECSLANALAIIGERWSLLALREIGMGNHRFDQIVRNTGASRDILAARLRKLVEAGVLDKQQYESHPPRYEYVLTEAGRSLRPILHGLMQWGIATSREVGPQPNWNTPAARHFRLNRFARTAGNPSTSTRSGCDDSAQSTDSALTRDIGRAAKESDGRRC
jgi:DNA-binding HxlR family transcriptional regulator